MKLEVEMHWNS